MAEVAVEITLQEAGVAAMVWENKTMIGLFFFGFIILFLIIAGANSKTGHSPRVGLNFNVNRKNELNNGCDGD